MKYRTERWNLLIASILILIVSILQWNRWGIKILQELEDGNFFFLGGPSLWYPTALFPTIVAIGYLLTFLISIGEVDFSQNDGVITITEKKGLIRQKAVIPLNSIISDSFSNIGIRWSALGCIVLLLSSYYLYADGISLLTYHAVFGYGIDTGVYYILQATVNIIAVILVMFFSPGEICIRSRLIDRVLVQIPVIWSGKQKKYLLNEYFQLMEHPIRERNSSIIDKSNLLLSLYGVILIIVVILTRIFLSFSNEVTRLVYLFVGILYLAIGIKKLTSNYRVGIWIETKMNYSRIIIEKIWIIGLSAIVMILTFGFYIYNLLFLNLASNPTLTAIINSMILLVITVPGVLLYILEMKKRSTS